MSTRARLAVAFAIALFSAAGIAILAIHWVAGAPRAAAPRGLKETMATAPFGGYREVRVAFGARCVRVAVADTAARREQGLRGIVDLGPYGGMLFAQRADDDTAFTMAGVTEPLEIAWYTANGTKVDAGRMPPCAHDAAHCPLYRSRRPYRFALETPPGASSPSQLQPCS